MYCKNNKIFNIKIVLKKMMVLLFFLNVPFFTIKTGNGPVVTINMKKGQSVSQKVFGDRFQLLEKSLRELLGDLSENLKRRPEDGLIAQSRDYERVRVTDFFATQGDYLYQLVTKGKDYALVPKPGSWYLCKNFENPKGLLNNVSTVLKDCEKCISREKSLHSISIKPLLKTPQGEVVTVYGCNAGEYIPKEICNHVTFFSGETAVIPFRS